MPDTRRRLSLVSLCRSPKELENTHQLVQQLADGKLLVTTYDMQNKQEMVEIIHDALLWEWGQLRHWLQEDRKFLLWHQELERQVRAWVETNGDHPDRRDTYKLLRGLNLEEAQEWLSKRSASLSQVEQEFIKISWNVQQRRAVIGIMGRIGGIALLAGGLSGLVWWLLSLPRYINVARYTGHTGAVWSVAWSPDNTRIASAGEKNDVQVWVAITGSLIKKYTDNMGFVTCITWSPDSYNVASGSYDKTIRVRSSDGVINPPNTYPEYRYHNHTDLVLTVAWSPDNQYIASGGGGNDMTVQVWRADPERRGELVYKYTGHRGPVNTVAWSSDSKYIASGSGDNTVHVWDAVTGENSYIYRGHISHVLSVAWSPNRLYIASTGWDQKVQVWHATTGKHIYTYSGHHGPVNTVAWSPDGKYIASAGQDQTVQVWDAHTGNTICIYGDHHSQVNSLAWSSSQDKLIASAGDDGIVRVWKLK